MSQSGMEHGEQPGAAKPEPLNVLLEDSLVEGMEKRMCVCPSPTRSETSSRLQAQSLSHSTPETGPWAQFFVEVDQLSDTEPEPHWQVTRRLRQGLELDINSENMRPHLPHVSLDGLSRVRELMGPKSVALDVSAPDAYAAVEAVVWQLCRVGLPQYAGEKISQALLDRTLHGAVVAGAAPTPPEAKSTELLKPSAGEEACVILSMAHSQVPKSSNVLGAFLRLDSPLAMSCAAMAISTRFLLVLVGPEGATDELVNISDSLAALAVDEDLMSRLVSVGDVTSFMGAVEDRLDALILMPHAHLHGGTTLRSGRKIKEKSHEEEVLENHGHGHGHGGGGEEGPWKRRVRIAVTRMQKYSIPLVSGVIIALIWNNAHEPSYSLITHGLWFNGDLFGDDVPMSLHFVVNDIFMCFFFGLAIKEVTEAVLPGGSLSPISRAANPLMATIGGIVGPIAAYVAIMAILQAADAFKGLMCEVPDTDSGDGHRRLAGGAGDAGPMKIVECTGAMLMKGWGVPIATDISLAWMFALLIFGAGHPAINFLLLLAIVDDAIGMAIIAIFYPNPQKPVNPVWLLLVLVAAACAGLLRILLSRLNMQFWSIYIAICGPISWLGLYKAHVHPALALVFVVPFMPATHARLRSGRTVAHLGAVNMDPHREKVGEVAKEMKLRRRQSIVEKAAEVLLKLESAPLHTFEHQLKLPVDIGMFFFGLANAGVKFTTIGGVTFAVVIALLLGKTLGIAGFALFASAIGFHLPAGVTVGDLFAMGALGGIGLTVALFMSNEAFVDSGLRGQAKIGAVISVTSAGLAWLLRRAFQCCPSRHVRAMDEDDDSENSDDAWIDDLVVEDVLEVLRMQRRYSCRGTRMPLERVARSVSKDTSSRRSSLIT